jgi:hypothetical protein
MDNEICQWCDEPVLPGQQNLVFQTQAMHSECGFRPVAGSVGHILRRCSCCSKDNLGDPPGLTKREAARAAFVLWRRIVDWYGEDVRR